MLNKELLMVGGAEELWTLQLMFIGESYLDLILQDSNGQTLWNGNPSYDIATVRVPPKSTLILSGIVGADYYIAREDGCLAEGERHEIYITVFQSNAYLEISFS